MKGLAIGLLFTLALAAQQTSRSYSTYVPDLNGRMVAGPAWTETSGPGSYTRTLDRRSVNGDIVPRERIRQQVVSETGSGKISERVEQFYDENGSPIPPRRVRIEERKNPDGTSTVTVTTSQQDINGHSQVVERVTSQIRASGERRSESAIIERPGATGTLEVAEKRTAVDTKSGGTEREQVTTYRKDINGGFYEAARVVTDRSGDGAQRSETVMAYEALNGGQLAPASRTVTRTKVLPDSSEVQESTVYRAWSATRVDSSSGMPVSEQILVERKAASGGNLVETTSVRKPAADYPYTMGKYEKVGEVVCSGYCKPTSGK